jgi:hypothetical protein
MALQIITTITGVIRVMLIIAVSILTIVITELQIIPGITATGVIAAGSRTMATIPNAFLHLIITETVDTVRPTIIAAVRPADIAAVLRVVLVVATLSVEVAPAILQAEVVTHLVAAVAVIPAAADTGKPHIT